ncbi:DUF6907 domain-containing protein [Streptomyces maoxianensis]|uniref:DUF6907 domain-containing protein n=1 Tax=Streptomyces maoxianensis TaxID=1459942 RepID=A0ABV9GDP2_9ACTN
MTAGRTVTVQTSDHGPVTLPEPSWCAGVHPGGGRRSDLSHYGRPTKVTLDNGRLLIEAQLAQWPYSVRDTAPFVALELGDAEGEYDQAALLELARNLLTFAAVTIPELRVRLAAATEEARL